MSPPSNQILGVALAVWGVAGIVLALLNRLLWDFVWVIGDALWLPYALCGVALLGLILWRPATRGPAVVTGLTGVWLLIGAGLWFEGGRLRLLGDDFLFRLRFARGLQTYERIVERIATDQPTDVQSDQVRFLVDAGPPRRVAFPLPGGFLDNWEGVVYDPSDAVATARGWGAGNTYTAPPALQKIFGGDLVLCRVVRRPYYRCWFT